MSIDQRLVEAFGLQDPGWNALAQANLQRVHYRRRRNLAVRRGVVAVGLVAATVLAGAVLADKPSPRTALDPGTATSSPSSALAGEWQTDQITKAQVLSTLRDAGLDEYTDDALAGLPGPPGTPFHIELAVARDEVFVDLVPEGDSTPLRYDEERLVLRGSRAVLRPLQADGRSVHRWEIVDGALRLDFVSTSEKPVDGVPGEVWQRIIYDTADFHR